MLIVTGGLPHCRVRSTHDSSCSLVSLNAHRAVFVVEKRVTVLEYHLDSAAWVLPGKINAMKGCVRCYWGLPLLSGDLNLRFFVLSVSLTAGKAVFVGGKRRE